MKKKLMQCLLALSLLVSFLVLPAAAADIGPKPSVTIGFQGLEGQTYYATLLGNTERYGPWSKDDVYDDYLGPKDVWDAFQGYDAPEGFWFLGFMDACTEDQQLAWTYYPPESFYVLLYFPDTGTFLLSSEPCSRYAFDSYFTADVSGGDITLKHSYAFTGEVISLVCRCVLTIAAELVIGWLFLFRGKELFRLICVTNAVSQILLNLALNITNYLFGSMGYVMFYVLLEAAVFVIEGIVYSAYLKRHPQEKQLRPWGYALVSNGLSFALGLWLSHVIPGIF